MCHFKHLTERERYLIEYLLAEKKPVREIAQKIGKSRATVYREIKNGTVSLLDSDLKSYRRYCADAGQRIYDERKHTKGAPLKVGNNVVYLQYIGRLIADKKYSPQAALDYMETHGIDFGITLSKGTIYSYIEKGLFLNVTNQNLPVKRCKKQRHRKTKVAKHNVKGRSSEERAKSILVRDEFGHWEMDTVYSGKGQGKACLLVLSERMLRLERVIKIPDRTQESVTRALDRLERAMGFEKFRKTFRTITCDNGVEFLNQEKIERSVLSKGKLRTTVYYCHPFCSGERGTNENINRMIRRQISKGDSIAKVSRRKIRDIEQWINDYPRRIFDGKSANQLCAEYGIDISALFEI